jgi:hypothetical protein
MTWLKLKFAAGAGAAALLVGGVATVAISGNTTNSIVAVNEQGNPPLIVPGEGVGQMRKRMTTNEVEAVLGKPDKWQGKIMVYDKNLGMSVGQTRNGVMVVSCDDSLLRYPGVRNSMDAQKRGSAWNPAVKTSSRPSGNRQPPNLGA